MVFRKRCWLVMVLLAGVVLLVAGCGRGSTPVPAVLPTETTSAPVEEASPTATPTSTSTPTPVAGGAPTDSPVDPCAGLSGAIEVQVLVGPAEAAGLEPVAVGQVPFSVAGEGPPYTVAGQETIAYDAVLEKEWGTYAVTLDMDVAVEGTCEAPEGQGQLQVQVRMNGEQLVEVDAGDFHGEYPWSGEHALEAAFPLEEGATVSGEGWALVLHLDGG
jgi:hypothetical protein